MTCACVWQQNVRVKYAFEIIPYQYSHSASIRQSRILLVIDYRTRTGGLTGILRKPYPYLDY